ncbi:anti-sigma factor [Paracoccus sp. MBLB3053]|uniref:Regulator of SigK n=1 Tax=Paracoccus aurantius TaxID=3073814 RepID=A0ABU2I021_9RHOB|nr:anti-sigma factor [Paracoccus sp. MBLB3053]MDS9470150.1 anti-sigma factor [Paracoccus sp. MBLB3053]
MIEESGAPDPGDTATAGEYVLGTLPHAERQRFRARLAREPQLQAEVERWEAHFDPLSEAFEPVTPPAGVWSRIDRRLFSASASTVRAGVDRLWRWLGLGASLAAVMLAGVLWLGPAHEPEAPSLWVSDMVSADGAVRLAALYDEKSGEMRVSVGGAEPADGRDFELWLIQGDLAPISLGVMPHQGQAAMPIPDELRELVANATLAITDEPAGGTPTGVATGPVVAAAPLRRI